MAQRIAVFLDRDGVIIEEVDYLSRPEQLRVLAGAARAIARLAAAGFKIIVISNQSAVARGYLTRKALESIHQLMSRRLRALGARLDAIYYCPHHPAAGRRVRCRCRKPGTLMLERAARKFKLDLRSSFFVGDTTTDVKTARNAGCRAVLVKTGKAGRDGRYKARPEATVKDLAAAASWILKRARPPRVLL